MCVPIRYRYKVQVACEVQGAVRGVCKLDGRLPVRKSVKRNKDIPRMACQSQEKLLKYSSTEQLVAFSADHLLTG